MTSSVPQDQTGRPLPRQATMGLLNYVTATSLDEDYAEASRRRAEGSASSPRRRPHLPAFAVLAVFGLLAGTAAVETARTAPVRQESQESLVGQVRSHRAQLQTARDRVAALRASVDQAQERLLSATGSGRATRAEIDRLAVAAGTVLTRGPGVRVVVDDAPNAATDREVVLDKDLQILANGLWAAGAEAVAVNRQRLTAVSAIRLAGSAITVNKVSLSRPYVVTAIGDPDQLPARLLESDAGTWWLNLKAVYGLQFSMSSEDALTLPAAPTPSLSHARAAAPERPGAGSARPRADRPAPEGPGARRPGRVSAGGGS